MTSGPTAPQSADPEPDDDDALSWEGDEQFGRAPGRRAPAVVEADADGEDAGDGEPEQRDDVRPRGQAAVTWLFGAIYLVLAIGWVFSVQLSSVPAGVGFLTALNGGFSNFLSLIAAPLWFAGTLHLTAESRTRTRVGWLALGTAILIPWPILLGAVIA